ncbi:MerR family transcriptional regulator [Dyadobacter sp. CY343]|uniref:MerR family transcriptional regulator n=1 Tax=Dyadobacter sp. CY343 TaxID=2907299 RepID=UPI001F1AC9BE|nr:MerR family transcriptional regulator [Dyadobacter sp. CY343]MCE7062053.1 MerR family transcriptional regulator [Dyadobacter sp. CY343]
MSSYSIRDLERISNTKAHTIRIWEQRYGLLTPERTDTNVRFYDDEQLKKLLNVCTLLNHGMKISRISQLTRRQMTEEIDKIIASSSQIEDNTEAIVNRALIAATTFDTFLFEEVFGDATKKLGLRKAYEKVIYPLLVRTGLMWVKDDLLPSQEHFLSNLVRQKLFAAIDALPLPENSPQKWLLFLNEYEDHEIGLLFAHYLIRQRGQQVVYLGARVPYPDLANVVKQFQPTHICSFFVSNQISDQLDELLRKLTTDFKQTTICISCGQPDMRETISRYKVTQIISIDKLIEMLNYAE